MNISNYARGLELSKYKINESAILEADADPAKALEQIKSGKAGGSYAAQWKQVQTAVITGHEADLDTGTVMVKHDNGSDMTTVNWKIIDGKVELSVAAAATVNKSTDQAKGISFDQLNKTYDPKNKFTEFLTALVAYSKIAVGNTTWGPANIKWIREQVALLDSSNKFTNSQISNSSLKKRMEDCLFLNGTGDVSGPIRSLTGSDATSGAVKIIQKFSLAGSAKSAEDIQLILIAIHGKLGEVQTTETDEKAMVSMYQLISPEVKYDIISKICKDNALDPMPTSIILEIDTMSTPHALSLIIWMIGTSGFGNNIGAGIASIPAVKGSFDQAAYTAAMSAIKSSIV
jgi:hypothetical protein